MKVANASKKNNRIDSSKSISKRYWALKSLALIYVLLTSFNARSQCTQTWNTIPNQVVCGNVVILKSYINAAPVTGDFSGIGVSKDPSLGWIFDPSIGIGTYFIYYDEPNPCIDPPIMTQINVVSSLVLSVNGNTNSKVTLYGTLSSTISVQNPSLYTNFKWYKNGFLDVANSCPTCSTYTTNDIGNYGVLADGCTTDMWDDVEIACDCDLVPNSAQIIGTSGGITNLSSTSFIGNGGVGQSNSNIDFVFKGTIVVGEDVIIDFQDANVRMEACAQIILEKAVNSGHYGGVINIENSTFTGCDKWAGFNIYGESSLDNSHPEHASLSAISGGFEISDAYKAIYTYEGGKLDIRNGSFENNLNNLTLFNYSFNYNPVLYQLDMRGTWMHSSIDYVTLCGTAPNYPVFWPSTDAIDNDKMIFIENIKQSNLELCTIRNCEMTPITLNYGVNNRDGLEIIHSTSINIKNITFISDFLNGIYAYDLVNNICCGNIYSPGSNEFFDNYLFNGNFDRGASFINCQNIQFGASSPSNNNNCFIGNYNFGTYFLNCSNINVYGNLFNTTSFSTTPPSSGGDIYTAIFFENIQGFRLSRNVFSSIKDYAVSSSFSKAGTFFDNNFINSNYQAILLTGINSNGAANQINIYKNRFVGNLFGVVIAPSDDPIKYSSNINQTQIDIELRCNFFKANNYAVVGCGLLKNQGSNNYGLGNKFESNIEWDWLWNDLGAGSFTYFDFALGNVNPNNRPNDWTSGLGFGNLLVNGVNKPLNFSHSALGSISDIDYCYSFLNKRTNTGIDTVTNNTSFVIINPISSELRILGREIEGNDIICYDALGKKHILSKISSFEGTSTFNAEELAPGMYFIVINNQSLKFVKN